jgi:hypothetical protein
MSTAREEQLSAELADVRRKIAETERGIGEANRLYPRDPALYQGRLDGLAARMRYLSEQLARLDSERRGIIVAQ